MPHRPRPWKAYGRALTLGLLWSLVFAIVGCERRPAGSQEGVLPADAPPPDVIFLLIDALRADRLGVYGHKGGLSPAMDAIAAEGIIFDRAIAQAPWTQPSVASLFCSYYPGVHKAVSYEKALEGRPSDGAQARVFAEAFTTLAEALQAAGYATAAFVANGFVVPELGFDQGFDHFDATLLRKPGNLVNEATIAWLARRDPSKPVFVYLHFMDVHGPYDAGPKFLDPLLDLVENMPDKRELTPKELTALNYLRRLPRVCNDPARHKRLMRYREYWVARYEAGVREADFHLATLREQLTEMGIWNDAYVILTADHGEALCEHGIWDHGLSVHHDQMHVPLILRWPGVLSAGKRIRPMVRLIDLMPTLLQQLRLPGVEGIQGSSVLPCLAGGLPAEPVRALGEAVKLGPEQKALYRGDWKLVYLEARPPRALLYNIAKDPSEQTDCSRQNPAELHALFEALTRQLAENERLAAGVEVVDTPMSEERRRQLEALGYVGRESDADDSPDDDTESPPPP